MTGNKKNMPLNCNHWGTYRVETEQGVVKALHGFEEDSDVSPIGYGIIDVVDGPTRIQSPMVRKSWLDSGPGSNNQLRGVDPFVEVSWEEAERLIATELNRVKNQYGNSSIFGGSYGWSNAGRFHHAQSQLHRFLNCIGGYTRKVGTYSFAAAEAIVPHVLGDYWQLLLETTDWLSVSDESSLVVAFGGMPLNNGQINAGGMGKHVQRESMFKAAATGVKFVNIGPIQADVDSGLNPEWVPLRPGTDTAMMLALGKTLIDESLIDPEFLGKYTTGFDKFRDYLNGVSDGVPKDANWAAPICAVSAEEIQSLARRMASNRTMISVSWSLTRHDHGEQPYWAAINLAAMLGQIGLPGAGITFGFACENGIGYHYTKIPAASLPQGQNAVSDFIPVARISDMLLNPGGKFTFDGKQFNYPDIHLIYWVGGNPFHHHQDLNKMLEAWRKPDTIIVNEWCWNSMAKHSDIVLPCTTTLERDDLGLANWDPYIICMQKVFDPVAGSRNDYDIFSGIARSMGVEETFTAGRSESEWIESIYQETLESCLALGIKLPEFEEFKKMGWFKVESPKKPNVMLEAFRDDPERFRLATDSGKIELFSETVAGFEYNDCPGHPIWLEPLEWLGGNVSTYPLHLISNQPKNKLHSQLDHGKVSRADKIQGREPLALNSIDAKTRGLVEGDILRVYNERGECLAGLVVDDRIMPGVAQMSTGAWYDPLEPGSASLCKHGNVNVLTPDIGSSQLAQGPIAHTCMVEVEKFVDTLPPITAYDPPQILPRWE